MRTEHQRWIAEALRLGQSRRFEEAYQLASLVICEDEKNPQALWLVAMMTRSLHERRWALKALLRLHPESAQAREMLNATNRKLDSAAKQTGATIRPIRVNPFPPFLTQ